MRTPEEVLKEIGINERNYDSLLVAGRVLKMNQQSYNQAIDDAFQMLDRFDEDHDLGDILTLKK